MKPTKDVCVLVLVRRFWEVGTYEFLVESYTLVMLLIGVACSAL